MKYTNGDAVDIIELAWFAGLLEGEGCFSVSKPSANRRNQRVGLRVFLGMCDLDVIERASRAFPGSTPIRARKPQTQNSRVMYYVTWGGAHAADLMLAVRPYMGERRGTKIDECLATPNLSHLARSRSGVKHVSQTNRGKWRARVTEEGSPVLLGTFDSKEEAAAVVQAYNERTTS